MSAITWLDKIGTDIKNDFVKAEPVAEAVVEDAGKLATPFISVYAPSLLPLVQSALSAIASAQAAGLDAAAGQSTDQAKLAAVLGAVTPIGTQLLASEGITATSAQFSTFIGALVTAVKAFEVPSPSVAPALSK
jgi:hypothetical protein